VVGNSTKCSHAVRSLTLRQVRPRSALDTIITAVAEAYGCTVITDHEKHIAGVEALNPVRGA